MRFFFLRASVVARDRFAAHTMPSDILILLVNTRLRKNGNLVGLELPEFERCIALKVIGDIVGSTCDGGHVTSRILLTRVSSNMKLQFFAQLGATRRRPRRNSTTPPDLVSLPFFFKHQAFK